MYSKNFLDLEIIRLGRGQGEGSGGAGAVENWERGQEMSQAVFLRA